MSEFIPRATLRYRLKKPLFMSFRVRDVRVQLAEVVDIGEGGLGAWVDDRYFSLFEPNLLLKEATFNSSAFKAPVPDIRLVFSNLKGQSARPGLIMLGGAFIDPGPTFLEELHQFFQALPEDERPDIRNESLG